LIVFILLLICNYNRGQTGDRKIIDSIKLELGFKDSIKLLKKNYRDGMHVYVFIDYNKNSIFHKEIAARYNNYFDTLDYKSRYELLQNSGFHKPRIPKKLKKKWVPLYKYKNEFFVVTDCYFQFGFEINDSTLIEYFMDGPNPNIITDIFQKNKIIKIKTTKNGFIDFNIIDEDRQIYSVNFGDGCGYFIPIDRVNDFTIIVQHCHEMEFDLIEFDKVNCKKEMP
jgi:hypothetical protein